jgi:putative FmdB family regulatory protein
MARYDFKCEKCDIVKEVIQSVEKQLPKTIECPSCKGRMDFVIPLVSLGVSTMDTAPIDVVVGRDADARWARINERQEVRNKVRQESGVVGLTATGTNEYQPIDTKQKFRRTDAMKTVEKDGFKPQYDDGDAKLINKR